MRYAILSAFAAAFLMMGGPGPALAVDKMVEVGKTVELSAKIADVWARTGGWCDIDKWHPSVAKCERVAGNKVWQRVVTMKDGSIIKDTLTDEGDRAYTYQANESPFQMERATAKFSIKDLRNGKVAITWTIKFRAKDGVDVEEVKKAVAVFISPGLDALKRTRW